MRLLCWLFGCSIDYYWCNDCEREDCYDASLLRRLVADKAAKS